MGVALNFRFPKFTPVFNRARPWKKVSAIFLLKHLINREEFFTRHCNCCSAIRISLANNLHRPRICTDASSANDDDARRSMPPEGDGVALAAIAGALFRSRRYQTPGSTPNASAAKWRVSPDFKRKSPASFRADRAAQSANCGVDQAASRSPISAPMIRRSSIAHASSTLRFFATRLRVARL